MIYDVFINFKVAFCKYLYYICINYYCKDVILVQKQEKTQAVMTSKERFLTNFILQNNDRCSRSREFSK